MLATFLKILPLDLASTLSPGILALSAIILGSKNHPKLRALALLTGSIVVGLFLASLGHFIGQSDLASAENNSYSSIIDIVLGFFLLILAFRTLFTKERRIKSDQENQKAQLWKFFLAGLVINITNFDAVILNFLASKEVSESLINISEKVILYSINIFFFSLPIILPILFYLFFPKLASKVLTKINSYILKYAKYIVFIIFMLLAIYLIVRGGLYFK